MKKVIAKERRKKLNAIISHRILCLRTQMRFMHICYCAIAGVRVYV